MPIAFRSEAHATSRRWGPVFVVLVGLATVLVFAGAWLSVTFNRLVRLDQAVQGQWAQVENAYQRRVDLIPNLVETVKGAAAFESSTLLAVTEARSQIQSPTGSAPTAESLEKYQAQQAQLSGALSRLLVTVEAYPQLKATQNFRDLQAQLEGTENRISVERMRFNEAAQAFNASRDSFPSNVAAGFFGARFAPKTFFRAAAGADIAPAVKF
jgi:LemA protein